MAGAIFDGVGNSGAAGRDGDSGFELYPLSVLPCLFVPGSRRVAIVDSGVLLDHPLLAGAIAEVHDVTGGTAHGMDDAQGLVLAAAGRGGVRVPRRRRRSDGQWGSVPRVRGGPMPWWRLVGWAVIEPGGTTRFQATLP